MEKTRILERLDDLKREIQTSRFLCGEGLSNEINIQMFCYDPKDEMAVRYFVSQLVVDQTLRCRIIERNLYEMFLRICDENRITDRIPAMEERKGGENLLKQLSGVITKDEFVAKSRFENRTPGKDILLITGVGDAFPFVRVHMLLESLQPEFPDIPILVMYPGKFNNHELKLFNKLKPNPYYRAFNVIEERGRA